MSEAHTCRTEGDAGRGEGRRGSGKRPERRLASFQEICQLHKEATSTVNPVSGEPLQKKTQGSFAKESQLGASPWQNVLVAEILEGPDIPPDSSIPHLQDTADRRRSS